jgi:hypothetical protein
MSNIITHDTKQLPSIPDLIILTLKGIYEPMQWEAKKDAEKYILRYYDAINQAKEVVRKKYGKRYYDQMMQDPRPLGTKGTPLDQTEFWIVWCSERLVWDEQNIGEVARVKRLMVVHQVDYKKFYRLPGAISAEDRAKAMMYLMKAQREHPEEY